MRTLVGPHLSERLDRLEYDFFEEASRKTPIMGSYSCPSCGARFLINRRLLDLPPYTPLSPQLAEAFDAAVAAARLKASSGCSIQNLDFACAGCDLPARIVYEACEVRMGTYSFQIVAVVELVAT